MDFSSIWIFNRHSLKQSNHEVWSVDWIEILCIDTKFYPNYIIIIDVFFRLENFICASIQYQLGLSLGNELLENVCTGFIHTKFQPNSNHNYGFNFHLIFLHYCNFKTKLRMRLINELSWVYCMGITFVEFNQIIS